MQSIPTVYVQPGAPAPAFYQSPSRRHGYTVQPVLVPAPFNQPQREYTGTIVGIGETYPFVGFIVPDEQRYDLWFYCEEAQKSLGWNDWAGLEGCRVSFVLAGDPSGKDRNRATITRVLTRETRYTGEITLVWVLRGWGVIATTDESGKKLHYNFHKGRFRRKDQPDVTIGRPVSFYRRPNSQWRFSTRNRGFEIYGLRLEAGWGKVPPKTNDHDPNHPIP